MSEKKQGWEEGFSTVDDREKSTQLCGGDHRIRSHGHDFQAQATLGSSPRNCWKIFLNRFYDVCDCLDEYLSYLQSIQHLLIPTYNEAKDSL